MNHRRRWLLYFLLILFLLGAAVESQIIATGQLSKPAPGDVIIVLGAKLIDREPSTMLRLRLDQAVELYRQGYARAVIVSGAKGADEPISEAEAMQAYLIRQGIPSDRILLEDGSYNTYQNLANSRLIMAQEGFRKAIIVSNASHIRRSLTLAGLLGIEATAAPAPMANNLYLTIKQYLREGAAMLALTANQP